MGEGGVGSKAQAKGTEEEEEGGGGDGGPCF